jgi:hypothetical protein
MNINPANLSLVDGVMAGNKTALDAAGAFLIGQLEKLDPMLHEPLYQFTYSRDLPIRSDATIADEYTSFMNIGYGAVGGPNSAGKNWFARESNVIGQTQVDYEKIQQPFMPWAIGASYDLFAVAAAAAVNKPLDAQMVEAARLKHQMDADELAYVGDTDLGIYGLCNNPNVTVEVAANNSGGTSRTWDNKTPQEVLDDVNTLLTATWKASAYAFPPTKILLPPDSIAFLNKEIVTSAGTCSILTFLKENNLAKMVLNKDLSIVPTKWLTTAGVNNTKRMVAYTQEKDCVRLPITPLARTNIQYDLLKIRWAYYGKMGGVEVVKSATIHYMDGI